MCQLAIDLFILNSCSKNCVITKVNVFGYDKYKSFIVELSRYS